MLNALIDSTVSVSSFYSSNEMNSNAVVAIRRLFNNAKGLYPVIGITDNWGIGLLQTESRIIAGMSRKVDRPCNPVDYKTAIRAYEREVLGKIRRAYERVVYQNIEDTIPDDWDSSLYDNDDGNKHAQAYAPIARRQMRDLTKQAWIASESERVLEALRDNPNADEIIALLESQLQDRPTEYVQGNERSWSDWQRNEQESDGGYTQPDNPIRACGFAVTNWKAAEYTGQFLVRNLAHWRDTGSDKHGDRCLVLNPQKFAERQIKKRWAGIESIVFTANGAPRQTKAEKAAIAVKVAPPSDRVARARERMRAKRAALKAAKANQ